MRMIEADLLKSKVTTPVDETMNLWLFCFHSAAYSADNVWYV